MCPRISTATVILAFAVGASHVASFSVAPAGCPPRACSVSRSRIRRASYLPSAAGPEAGTAGDDADTVVPAVPADEASDDASAAVDTGPEVVSPEKESLLELCTRLNRDLGSPFVTSRSDKLEVGDAASALETSPDAEATVSAMLGRWKLLCTTNSSANPTTLPGAARGGTGPLSPRLVVYQQIRPGDGAGDPPDAIGRIDNVLEFSPPESSGGVADGLLRLLNPLGVTGTKISLIHSAEVEAEGPPVLRTRIALKSVVLNVAGTSKVLDAGGGDVFGLNLPGLPGMEEFANAGKFDTTYVDGDVRISRGTVGYLDQLRVFVRED
mmetsp:Transcript_34808/g.68508  ORF Transcript_34808/g.68508 Transcript_34808/m.68508 type:complete len:325 (-) Transcript_34808:241-1215(-)